MTRDGFVARAALVLAFVTSLAPVASAHQLAFGTLDVTELEGSRVEVRLRFSGSEQQRAPLAVVLPAHCTRVRELALLRSAELGIEHLLYDCARADGRPLTLRVTGLEESGIDLLATITRKNGITDRRILTESAPGITLATARSTWSTANDYLRLGVEHVLGGLDHLAFVFALLLLATRTREFKTSTRDVATSVRDVATSVRDVATSTACFTLGHSVTLVLAALDVVRVPSAPTEAAIALSVVLLARELVRAENGEAPRARETATMAGLFGLVHGLGFAGALAEIGLPPDALPLSLASFNVGVELGQLVFVAAAGSALAFARRLHPPGTAHFRALSVRAIGAVGLYWLVERLA